MSAKVFFSDKDGRCRLEVSLPDGSVQDVRFEKTSSLVNYCREFGITVLCRDCVVE